MRKSHLRSRLDSDDKYSVFSKIDEYVFGEQTPFES